MPRTLIVSAAALALTGCAYGLPGMGGPDIVGQVLNNVLYPSSRDSSDFVNAAANACGEYASQYGRVSIVEVEQISNSSLRVHGFVDQGGLLRRQFGCTFRNDGRITDFDID